MPKKNINFFEKSKNKFSVLSEGDNTGLVDCKYPCREKGTNSMKSVNTTADILNVLLDGKIHTLTEIAFEVEVSYPTVQRHIAALSYRFPVETFQGGDRKGGVQFDKMAISYGRLLTREQLALAAEIFANVDESVFDAKELANLVVLQLVFSPEKYCKEET